MERDDWFDRVGLLERVGSTPRDGRVDVLAATCLGIVSARSRNLIDGLDDDSRRGLVELAWFDVGVDRCLNLMSGDLAANLADALD